MPGGRSLRGAMTYDDKYHQDESPERQILLHPNDVSTKYITKVVKLIVFKMYKLVLSLYFRIIRLYQVKFLYLKSKKTKNSVFN